MNTDNASGKVKGRFAPSPSGRMHIGNIYAAVMSWLSAKRRGGKWVLRIEDLDPQRSKMEYARMIEDDLLWLGLEWDEGGLDGIGDSGPYLQSLRHDIYGHFLSILKDTGFCYRCRCTRADIMATRAPHESDGRVVYKGTCRPPVLPSPYVEGAGAVRIAVPDETIEFTDRICGKQRVNLAGHCGDFVLRRADGAWAYQFAVVVDDALMGITEVVRGSDLLLSAAQQIYLYRLLGFAPPEFAHLPLICNDAGVRLSKRDSSLSMEYLRAHRSAEEILGNIAFRAKIIERDYPISLPELLEITKKMSNFATQNDKPPVK
ncbi:MAG: tRNA glutamyl-Q(34) synthetase GluQRS [Muribaculaceae bacterium]|nr:tRNA glutamyl-Q(34) synthetase GluQRS [Muribaculaceae bacterium]